jgi:hypothetical protein
MARSDRPVRLQVLPYRHPWHRVGAKPCSPNFHVREFSEVAPRLVTPHTCFVDQLKAGQTSRALYRRGWRMKKVIAAQLVGLLTLTLSGVAGAASDQAAVDIAKGKGTDTDHFGTFNFTAIDLDGDPFTVGAKGHVSYEGRNAFSGFSLKGPVTCLQVTTDPVSGVHFATLSGPIEKTNDPILEGAFFFIHVTDSGLPNGEGDTFNLTSFQAPRSCLQSQFETPRPITEGDILISDGTPPA